jgi:hypothetical protein
MYSPPAGDVPVTRKVALHALSRKQTAKNGARDSTRSGPRAKTLDRRRTGSPDSKKLAVNGA